MDVRSHVSNGDTQAAPAALRRVFFVSARSMHHVDVVDGRLAWRKF